MKNKWWGLLAIFLVSSHLAHAKWETYTDTVLYNFSVTHPDNWTTEIHGNNLVMTSPDGSDSVVIAGDTEQPEVEGGVDSCKKIDFTGQLAYDCPNGSFMKTRAIYFPFQKIIINQKNQKSRTAKKIISSFRFISDSKTAQQGGTVDAATSGPRH
jgi:hypothetical protein